MAIIKYSHSGFDLLRKTLAILTVLFFTFSISNAYADVIIWQAEANPTGADSGNEWLTILNTGEGSSLDGWYVKTTNGRTATQEIPHITLDKCHHYKVSFTLHAIDNKNEQILLYGTDSPRPVDMTVMLKDTKNNDWIYENIRGDKCSHTYPASTSSSYTNNDYENNFERSESERVQELEKEIKRLNGTSSNLKSQLKHIL